MLNVFRASVKKLRSKNPAVMYVRDLKIISRYSKRKPFKNHFVKSPLRSHQSLISARTSRPCELLFPPPPPIIGNMLGSAENYVIQSLEINFNKNLELSSFY